MNSEYLTTAELFAEIERRYPASVVLAIEHGTGDVLHQMVGPAISVAGLLAFGKELSRKQLAGGHLGEYDDGK